MSDRLLSPRELADKLGVSITHVYRHAPEWPCVRIGQLIRFDYDQVFEYLQQHDQEAP